MDKGTNVIKDKVDPELLTGRRIITSTNLPIGTAYVTVDYIICRPTSDLVWPNVWANIVYSERNKARRHLRELMWETYESLGLTYNFPE